MIPHNKCSWGVDAAQAAYDIVLSGHLAAGERVLTVEKEWAMLTRSEDAAMVSSGVSALRLALITLGVGPGDEVIIPAYSCVALHNAVLSVGAKYILADIKADDLTICADSVHKKTSNSTKAIIDVHLFGARADIEALKQFDVPVIEDMAHGIFEQQGDLAISSFGPTKLIGSCYGGIVSGKKELIDKVKDWRGYGDQEPSPRRNDLPKEIAAAIALEQLKNIQEPQVLRTGPALDYDHMIKEWAIPVELLQRDNPWNYLYFARLIDHNAAEISEAMKAKGVCSEMPVWDYRDSYKLWPGRKQFEQLPNTNTAFDQVLSLPLYKGITFAEQELVVKTLGEVLG